MCIRDSHSFCRASAPAAPPPGYPGYRQPPYVQCGLRAATRPNWALELSGYPLGEALHPPQPIYLPVLRLALRRRKIWDNPHGAPTPLHESRCVGNTTKGPQPGFVSFICLHKPASPRFSPLSGVVPRWASAAQLPVWGYVGKFCVSCISLWGVVNNHTCHGMFRHKAPCRA